MKRVNIISLVAIVALALCAPASMFAADNYVDQNNYVSVGKRANVTMASKDAGSNVHKPKVYVVNGDDEAQGAKADAAVTNPASSGSVIALLKGLLTNIATASKQDTAATKLDSLITNSNPSWSASNIATNTTTTAKSGAGILHTITINTKGASANVATVYDNTAGSGTKLATIDTTSGPITLRYDVAFATGLTIVTATGTAADITVSYR
jgi:hypothetical protein